MRVPPTRLTLYPNPTGRLCVHVFIYPTLTVMRQAVRAFDRLSHLPQAVQRRAGPTRRLGGCCYGVTERGRRSKRMTPTFAIVLLSQTQLGVGTLSHELWHATCRYLNRCRIRVFVIDKWRARHEHETEERGARAHDAMFQQLVRALYRKKLLTT